MSRHVVVVALLAAGLLAGLTPLRAVASTAVLPPKLYPPHTSITFIPVVSNERMDCDWGFTACPGGKPLLSAPLFHLRTQDELHRISGWAQFGDTGKGRMLFALFASTYAEDSDEGMPWNVRAFADFRGALMIQNYSDFTSPPRLLPKGDVGNSSMQRIRSADGDVLAMASWTHSIEVEAVVIYAHSPTEAKAAEGYLVSQVRAAVRFMLATESNPPDPRTVI